MLHHKCVQKVLAFFVYHATDRVSFRKKSLVFSILLASSREMHGVSVQNSMLATSKRDPSAWYRDNDGLLKVMHGELVPC
jgi:hypothetical protein